MEYIIVYYLDGELNATESMSEEEALVEVTAFEHNEEIDCYTVLGCAGGDIVPVPVKFNAPQFIRSKK